MTVKRRKTVGPKRRARKRPSSRRTAAGSRDSRRFRRERDEALKQQAATSEILGVISRSPADVQPVLNTIVCAAVKLCSSYDAEARGHIDLHQRPIRRDESKAIRQGMRPALVVHLPAVAA